eukprot:scaffold4116_cov106-Isochrysis_galbana.AAC.6
MEKTADATYVHALSLACTHHLCICAHDGRKAGGSNARLASGDDRIGLRPEMALMTAGKLVAATLAWRPATIAQAGSAPPDHRS